MQNLKVPLAVSSGSPLQADFLAARKSDSGFISGPLSPRSLDSQTVSRCNLAACASAELQLGGMCQCEADSAVPRKAPTGYKSSAERRCGLC